MNKISAVIADDEPLARRGIRQMLSAHEDISVVAETCDAGETVRVLRQLKPELIFLDVQMPGLDGFGVIKTIGVENMPAVIFVTAHDEFAVQAFDAHALDYLVKPLEEERFSKALDRVRERRRSAEAFDLSRRLSSLLATKEKERAKQRIIVPTSSGDLAIDLDEIDWIEADDYYAAIHARNRHHLLRESLSSLMKRLDPTQFVRVHRSAIVKIDRVCELRQEGVETVLILRDGTTVPVSRRRRAITRQIFRAKKF